MGTPEKIAAALDAESAKQTGASKEEFDAALPHLKALLLQNYLKTGTQFVSFTASGSGYSVNGEEQHRNCNVTLEQMGSNILV